MKPDWLLIEIESNFLTYYVQAKIVRSIISPLDNYNSIMQLYMREGKISVIVSIVVTSLTDGKKVIHVMVLKLLSGQIF